MKVETSEGIYFVDWVHEQIDNNKIKYRTICLVKGQEYNLLENDIAWCSRKDNFCKERGRKISLARAIKDWDKAVRTEIWKAYLNRKVNNGSNN